MGRLRFVRVARSVSLPPVKTSTLSCPVITESLFACTHLATWPFLTKLNCKTTQRGSFEIREAKSWAQWFLAGLKL